MSIIDLSIRMHAIVQEVNRTIKEHRLLDVKLYSYSEDGLVLGLNENLTYSHKFEIRFKNVFAVDCVMAWTIETEKDLIRLIDVSEEAKVINMKYGVIKGNFVFELQGEDDKLFYIIAEEISFAEHVVKYY
ncbi:hypothetical protein [Chitinophaga rhizophila]|uniref:Immunity protein 50 of polymorphic toxin system n=1 Tax=Chitinophaga rhizophila TaxID=2866212 RepID=A0ABS7GH17_9BACT|nr:hypothetical protein [Chitinophaga rhizophila]MBW8686993.1 hypothetical protein [Chitinophaga rhizophila]